MGFIRDLPHDLVAAFRATLEEVTEADFLVHVVDASHPRMAAQIEAVYQVLAELEAADKPMVTVFNKSDLVDGHYGLRKIVAETPNSVYISALKREGIPQLMAVLGKTLQGLLVRMSLEIPYDRSDLVSLCYDSGKVLSAEYTPDGILVVADVSHEVAGRLERYVRSAG